MCVRMLNLSRCFVITLVICVSSVIGIAQDEGVLIFNGKDAVGMNQPIPVGVFQVDGKQLGSSVSVKVPKDHRIRFCEAKDGTGSCEEFGEGIHNLASV